MHSNKQNATIGKYLNLHILDPCFTNPEAIDACTDNDKSMIFQDLQNNTCQEKFTQRASTYIPLNSVNINEHNNKNVF